MVDARNKKINCKDCKKLNGRDGTQRKMDLPSKGGQWDTPDGKPPSSGNGKFTFDNPKTLPTDAPSNISTSSTESRISRNTPIATKKYDLCEVTGKDEKARKELMGAGFKPPSTANNTSGYVFHHASDGSVMYVPRVLHDKGMGGVVHTGGNSTLNNQFF